MLLLLLWCCLFVTTLSQVLTHVAKEDGALHIENIQYDGKFTHLTMKKMAKPKDTKAKDVKLKKGDFEWVIKGKSKILGHYKSFSIDSHKMVNIEFEYFPQMALSTLESLITKGMIKYDGKFIKAPPLYMISAHGGEYKKLLKPPELSSGELRDLEWDNRDNPTPKPTMGPTVDSLNRKEWPYKSTIYFFSPRYTCITMLEGEKYSKWFEGAEFMKLKNVVKTSGEIVKNGDMISEHYASYGTEFEVSSGVYRLVKNRKTKKWEVEIIARLPEKTKKANVKLSDIVDILEQIEGYGPGIVYWNACRQDTTEIGVELPGKHGTTPFAPLFNPLNPKQTEEWRKSVITDCENEYEKAWEETIEFATKEMADFERLVENGEKAVVKRKDNIQAKKEIVEEFYKSVKKISTRPKGTPKISVYDCYGAGYRVKALQQEIRNKYTWAYQKIMGLVESEKEKSTKKMKKLYRPDGTFIWVSESSDDSDESEFHFLEAHEEYSNYYDGHDDIRRHRHRRRHGHQHTMSYYDILLEKEEMMDILRDMNRDNKGKQTNPYYY